MLTLVQAPPCVNQTWSSLFKSNFPVAEISFLVQLVSSTPHTEIVKSVPSPIPPSCECIVTKVPLGSALPVLVKETIPSVFPHNPAVTLSYHYRLKRFEYQQIYL